MTEILKSKEKRIFTGAGLLLMGSAALSGCTSSSDSYYEWLGNMLPVERYDHEYGNGMQSDKDCLALTPFDAHALGSKNEPTALFDRETGILTITATNGEQLRMTDFDQLDHTPSPVDVPSEQIFAAYGCEVIDYGREDQ